MSVRAMNKLVQLSVALLLALCAQATLACARASAQVVVLRIDPAAEPMSEQLEAALSQFGLVPDPGYFAEAQREGLDPSSDQALVTLTPPAGAQLALVPRGNDDQSVQVEFRDGRSGAGLGTAEIPLLNGQLGPEGQQALANEVTARLGGTPGAPPIIGATGESGAPPAEQDDSASNEPSETALEIRALAGVGFGTRSLEWPSAGETLSVSTGAFLAVELGVGFAIAFSRKVTLGPDFAYQTSLDHEIDETHIAGAMDTLRIRAHRFAGLLALTFKLGSSGGFRIMPAIGYGTRNLRPEVHHLLTPSYSLGGPMARLGFRIPFGGAVALRLAPEAQLISVGDALEERGVASSGIAFGGEAELELTLSEKLALELSFREAHAIMSSSQGDSASDVERFSTARLVWTP